MTEQVWIAEIGVLDSECYAEGTDVHVTVQRTRAGAAAAIRERFKRDQCGYTEGD